MAAMLLAVTFSIFLVACLFSMTEAICERDWPRETFKYVLMAAVAVIACLY